MKLLRVRKPWVNPLRRKSPFFVAATTFTKSAKTTLCSVQLSHYCFFFFHFPFFDEVVGRKLVREQKHCCYCYYSCCCYQALSQLLTTFGQKGLKRASNPAYLPFYLMEKRKLSSFWLLPLCFDIGSSPGGRKWEQKVCPQCSCLWFYGYTITVKELFDSSL